MKIHNDLVTSIDQGHIGALVLLDMSVYHHLILRILNTVSLSVTQRSLGSTHTSQTEPKQSTSVTPSPRSLISVAACLEGRRWVQRH